MKLETLIIESAKAALAGGRHYGITQHNARVTWLADKLIEADKPADRTLVVAAIVKISNISATQQAMAEAGVIDRTKRDKAGATSNIYAALKAGDKE